MTNDRRFLSSANAFSSDNICIYCLSELARGVPEDGKCGHEALRERDRLGRLSRHAAPPPSEAPASQEGESPDA